MSTLRARSLSLSILLILSISLAAQESKPSRVVTAAATDSVRFLAPGAVAQIRVQIMSPHGESLFDSSWRDGNVLDWAVEKLEDGDYRCTVTLKDLQGVETQSDSALMVRGGQITIEAVDPKIALLVHDDKDGALVNGGGDLTFRFGNFLHGKDTERMRLTAEGNLGIGTDKPQARLDVNGMIRASEGIMFSDGTILRISNGDVVIERRGRTIMTSSPRSEAPSIPRRLVPAPNVSPDFQFKVDATGVHVGTTNAFGLDVFGNVTLSSNLALPLTGATGTSGVITLTGSRFVHAANGGTNVFVGLNAGNFATTGTNNAALGQSALFNIADGTGNTAAGQNAMLNTTSGSDNTATGTDALKANNLGSNNTAIGSGALESNTGGSNNVGIGLDALDSNTTGSNNIAIGNLAGLGINGTDNNIDIGNQAFVTDAGTTRIGTPAKQTKTFISGIVGVTTGQQNAVTVVIDSNGQLGTISSSRRFKFDIEDMADDTESLMQLRPVTFRYRQYGDAASKQYGLIAEEVAEVYPDMVTRDKDGNVETVMYQFLAPMLLNEVQKQHHQIEAQQKLIDELERRLAAIEARK